MSIFEAIRARVSAREAAERYGLGFRGNRARCPWHDDTHPDLAFYESGTCYCHACHHGGDAAALTAQIFGLTMIGAARKINADFGLGLDTKSALLPEDRKRIEQRHTARRRETEQRRDEWAFLCAVRHEADRIIKAAEQKAADRDLVWDDPAFQAALSRRARADNELDRMQGAETVRSDRSLTLTE